MRVDLARSPEGKWWVLADRTQAPSGAGYALENRIVLTRAFPDEYRDSRTQRLAGFFQSFRDTLRSLRPGLKDQPNVVLLTPGPFNETYFEHSFLARYLGFPLVEGGDLTVRDRRVFIKTLEGLQPVEVLLRRVDDTFCDPLELRADSSLGVPGLLEAARAGNVTIANALGSGVVETPALMAFLPGLCRELLGEEFCCPAWPLGGADRRRSDYVRENLEQIVVKPALRPPAGEPIFGARLTPEKRRRTSLAKSGRAIQFHRPGTEWPQLRAGLGERAFRSLAPWSARFSFAPARRAIRVMPGGLTRFSSSADRLVVSMQSGGGSKDTWVLADGPVSTLTLLKPQPK